ncbi:tRNA 2-thiouridine(34) synthase MnmA [Bacillota bacterium LX-D]|nr:tRNA 2-thiouridine(34) synthase MnmA [Bacillota bacterium LX-D]
MQKKRKVLMAMSGGVDSSVAAALLLRAGYEVVGVTMQLWTSDEQAISSETACCSLSAVEDARRVAQKLGIPYYVLNFKGLFQEKVIDYFIDEYLLGKTPNPCIACNKYVKFDALLTKARALELDYVATGHYAKVFFDESKQRYMIAKAKDKNKDQTYVLYNLTQDQLQHTLMPLGNYTKPEIRQIAAELGFSVANKPESQEICFVSDNNYRRFIKENSAEEIKPGFFYDTKGNVLGQHQGIPFYTIGQRKGLGIALGYPVYVIDIVPEKNAIILGKLEELEGNRLISENNNFILFDQLRDTMQVTAKVRYKAEEVKATISPGENEGQVEVILHEPQFAITPGQAVVFYNNELVVGGGTIKKKLG